MMILRLMVVENWTYVHILVMLMMVFAPRRGMAPRVQSIAKLGGVCIV